MRGAAFSFGGTVEQNPDINTVKQWLKSPAHLATVGALILSLGIWSVYKIWVDRLEERIDLLVVLSSSSLEVGCCVGRWGILDAFLPC